MSQNGWKRLTAGALAAQLLCMPTVEAVSLAGGQPKDLFVSYTASNRRKGTPRIKLVAVGESGDEQEAPADDEDSQVEQQTGGEDTFTPEDPVPSLSGESGESLTSDADPDETPVPGETADVDEAADLPAETVSGSPAEEELLEEPSETAALFQAEESQPQIFEPGTMAARGTTGYAGIIMTGKDGYLPEGTAFNSADWLYPEVNDLNYYYSKNSINAILDLTASDICMTEEVDRIPNYEFSGWKVYKGYEFSSDVSLLIYLSDNEEEMIDYTEDISYGYAFQKNEDGSYLLHWTNAEVAEEMLQTLDDANLLISDDATPVSVDDWENRYYMLYFGAEWQKSKNAALVGALSATTSAGGKKSLYSTSATTVDTFAAMSNTELEHAETVEIPLSTDITTVNTNYDYFVRTESNEDEITLTVTTYEPGSVVYVERIFDSETVQYRAARTLIHGPDNGNNAMNSAAAPARAQWTVTVPLEMSQGEGKLYNELRIVVVPPSDRTDKLPEWPQNEVLNDVYKALEQDEEGNFSATENAKVYTVYAQRLNEPELIYEKGNTPAGVIANFVAEEDRATALATFKKNYAWTTGNQPSSNTSLPYKLNGKFSDYAWKAWAQDHEDADNPNLDLDDEAIVVYLNSKTELPALQIVDSLGRTPTDLTVTRSLAVRVAESLDPHMFFNETPGTEEPLIATVKTGGADTLDLTGKKIVPGVYELEYTYTDFVTSHDYTSNSAPELFPVDSEKIKTFHRPLIVLPIPGDVDMDGAVTSADGSALEELITYMSGLGSSKENELARIRAGLFLYRVCDVDGNGTVNISDAQQLCGAAGAPLYKGLSGGSDYRYWPFGRNVSEDNEKAAQAPEQAVTTNDDSKAGLRLEYLGKGADINNLDTSESVDLKEVFWVGLKLENAANLNTALGSAKSITVTIAVDGRYAALAGDVDTSPWTDSYDKQVVYGTKQEGKLSPDGTSNATAWRSGHPSKAKASFEDAEDEEDGGSVWEYQLTVTHPDGLTLTDGYLLRIPLTLIDLPDGSDVILAEPAFGMRELCIRGTLATAAYDCGSAIFGGTTQNLEGHLEYRGSGAIPLGQDTTEAELMVNRDLKGNTHATVYGEEFSCRTGQNGALSKESVLPAGIHYDGDGVFSGTPWEVGTFENIYVGGRRFKMVVEKAPLTLTVQPGARYYGEQNPEAVFVYNPDQIKERDRGDKTLTGSMEELAGLGLADYQPPAWSYWETQVYGPTAKPLTADASANQDGKTYFVTIRGASATNYTFNYTVVGQEETSTEGGWNTFTVEKRPVLVGAILTNPVYIKSSASQTTHAPEEGKGRLTGESGPDFTVVLPDLGANGLYNGLPLTNSGLYVNSSGVTDWLKIEYEGHFVQTEEDKAAGVFAVTEPLETRDVDIDQVAFTGGAMDNYELISTVPVESTVKDGGWLLRDYVTKLQIAKVPAKGAGGGVDNDEDGKLEYTHGDQLNMVGTFSVYAPLNTDDEATAKQHYSGFEDAVNRGIQIFWAKKKEDADEPAAERINAQEQVYVSRAELDGCYLWAQAVGYDKETGQAKDLYSRSVCPLEISKKTLKLTVAAAERYYGEPDPVPQVSYSVSELSPADQSGKTGDLWNDFSAETVPGYAAPTVRWVTGLNSGVDVQQNSTAFVDQYYVILSGAQSTDYEFTYARTEYSGRKQDGTDSGWNTYQVYPRPIIVTGIQDVLNAAGVKLVPRAIYADDEQISFTEWAQAGGGIVEAAMPKQGKNYYYQTSTEKVDGLYQTARTTIALPLTGNAVYDGDQVTISYLTSYIPDQGLETVVPHFTLTSESETRTVNLTDVAIDGSKNYTLLFTNNENAQYGYPGDDVGQTQPMKHRTEGTVRSKEIVSVTISVTPKLSYTHGESLFLNDTAAPLTVKIVYSNDEVKYVKFNVLQNGSFADAKIHLTWDAPWAKDGDNAELTESDDLLLSHTRDDQRKLFVTVEQLGALPPKAAEPLVISVGKGTVTLTAVDQYRYYGEDNAAYTFSFQTKNLSAADRQYLFDRNITTSTSPTILSGAAAETALKAVNGAYATAERYEDYEAPEFQTDAGKTSAPNGGTEDGAYVLELSGGGMTNYTFAYEQGAIRVFKRPIMVTEVTAVPAASLPIESEKTKITVTLSQAADESGTSNMTIVLPVEAGKKYPNNTFDEGGYGTYYGDFDPNLQGLPLTGGGVVEEESVYISLTATFPERGQRGSIDAGENKSCTITISDMALTGESANNYCLVSTNDIPPTTPQTNTATGWLTQREIESITLTRGPSLDFQYADVNYGILRNDDLASMQFDVKYKDAGTVNMSYETLMKEVTPELYYWGEDWSIPGADWEEWASEHTGGMTPEQAQAKIQEYINEAVKQMKADKAAYKAAVNDHLSISTVQIGTTNVSHQGMHLLILVPRQNVDGAGYAVPVVTTNAVNITPKKIPYTVRADDKVYDGSTATSGDITLTGVYAGDEVDVDWDAMTFRFVDPNVAYADAAAGPHNYGELADITVEVDNIHLTGHDAENYEIDEKIGADYKPTILGRPSAAPKARITKADRAEPVIDGFELSVGEHTNILTVSHTGELVGNASDAHNEEIHWEYVLEYPAAVEETEEASGTPAEWPLEATPWQDEAWFGGEKADGSDQTIQPTAGGDTGFGAREPLPKDTWFRAGVRVSESWNYNASPVVYSATEADLMAKVEQEESGEEGAEDGATDPATPAEPDGPAAGGDEESAPEEPESVDTTMAKTYRYRLDVYTIPEDQSGGAAPTLDAVWFNDIDLYAKKDELDAALENVENAKGYYDYYLSSNRSSEVSYPWDLTEIQSIGAADGADAVEVPDNGNVVLYATTKQKSSSGGGPVKPRYELTIEPEYVEARVGDEPLELDYIITPEHPNPKLRWSSSDTSVVKVDEYGVLTFVGEGEATITLRLSGENVQVSIRVVVLPAAEALQENPYAGKALDVYTTGAFMELDEDMRFHPEWTMTRGELAMLLARLLIAPEGETPGEALTFGDIKEGDACAEAVEQLSRWGIVNGMVDGNFHPELEATRAEVVVMLSRMLRLGQSEEPSLFLDGGAEDTWAAPYLKELANAGVIQGTGGGYFNPKRLVTKAEVAAFVARLLAFQVDRAGGELRIPSDVTEDHWAYQYILRAVNDVSASAGGEESKTEAAAKR